MGMAGPANEPKLCSKECISISKNQVKHLIQTFNNETNKKNTKDYEENNTDHIEMKCFNNSNTVSMKATCAKSNHPLQSSLPTPRNHFDHGWRKNDIKNVTKTSEWEDFTNDNCIIPSSNYFDLYSTSYNSVNTKKVDNTSPNRVKKKNKIQASFHQKQSSLSSMKPIQTTTATKRVNADYFNTDINENNPNSTCIIRKKQLKPPAPIFEQTQSSKMKTSENNRLFFKSFQKHSKQQQQQKKVSNINYIRNDVPTTTFKKHKKFSDKKLFTKNKDAAKSIELNDRHYLPKAVTNAFENIDDDMLYNNNEKIAPLKKHSNIKTKQNWKSLNDESNYKQNKKFWKNFSVMYQKK